MASLDLEKLTLSAARGLRVHNGQHERETLNHSNPDIDKTLTAQNYTIGCTDYSEALRKMEERTKAVDAVQPPKRNNGDKRIVAVSVYAPCPQSIRDGGRADEFHQAVCDFYCDQWGAENVHGMCVHRDEIHKYVDKHGEERESLEHSHTLVSPYTTAKGINGKEFMQRQNLVDIQAEMNAMVKERFGVDYNTGDTPERKTVEQLKREQIKAQTEKEINELREEKINTAKKPKIIGKNDGFVKVSVEEYETLTGKAATVDNAHRAQKENDRKAKELAEAEREFSARAAADVEYLQKVNEDTERRKAAVSAREMQVQQAAQNIERTIKS